MPAWLNNSLPTEVDGDVCGMVLWGKRPGLLMPWHEVRSGEFWAHSSAWKPTDQPTNKSYVNLQQQGDLQDAPQPSLQGAASRGAEKPS